MILNTLFGSLFHGAAKLGTTWIESKSKKWQAQADIELAKAKHASDWDTEAMRQMQHSFKDELIAMIWFAPLIVAWWKPKQAKAWVTFVVSLPPEWWIITFAIVAASFGVRWLFTSTGKKVIERKIQ